MTEATEIHFRKICVYLEGNDKSRRIQALKDIKDLVIQDKCQNEQELHYCWQTFHKPLVRTLNDHVEACRELAVEILKQFILSLPVDEANITYIIPIMARRLGSQELIEQSEEIRLNCISLIRLVMDKYRKHLKPYFEDLMTILVQTVTNNYPNVKRESCQAISDLAKIIPQDFYVNSENFVKGVLGNFTHQHYRVRMAAVNTIGDVLQYGKSTIMEEIATPLAQRLFDQSAAVRATVINVAGKWMIDLRDKYSWWHKLIPLLLTGLHDEIQAIREQAQKLWEQVGLKYLEENESDKRIKDQMDFLIEKPKHYPPNIQRPNLGCRILAQQNLSKLVNGIVHELDDWLVDIKIRSAQLLCVLVFNAEQDVTINIEKLLPAMYRACNDEDKRVVENVELAAKYMGYFIPPSTYCPLVLLSLEENTTAGHWRVFASILSGSERTSLQPELEEVAQFIQKNYRHSLSSKYQMQVLNCCESLISVCKEDCKQISFELFQSIFSTMAITTANVIVIKAKKLLSELAILEDQENLNTLYSKHIRNVLKDLQHSSDAWTFHSPDFKIFQMCISEAWCTISPNQDLVIPIFEKTTSSKADAEVRLKQYILLSEYLSNKETKFDGKLIKQVKEFVNAVLENVIFHGLIWSAGRTAEAIRTASVCCLCALLDKICNVFEPKDKEIEDISMVIIDFGNFFEKTVPVLVTLMDDNAVKTRFYSLKAICLVVIIGREVKCVTAEHVNRIYPVLLKRLDDGSDTVRRGAIEALQELWKELPEDYDLTFYVTHIDMIYTTAIIHLDDPETEFQELMLDAMKNLAKVHPGLLLEKIQKCRYNFRNQQGLDSLVDHIKDFSKSK